MDGRKEGRELTSVESRDQLCARYDSERSSSYELHVRVCDLDVLSSMPVFSNDLDDGEGIRWC